MNLQKHAKRLHSRICELDQELAKANEKLATVQNDKESKLLKSAMSPNGKATQSIERISQEILFLKGKVEDTTFIRNKLLEELHSTALQIKEARISDLVSKKDEVQALIERRYKEIEALRLEALKLQATVTLVPIYLDENLTETPREENLVNQRMVLEGEISMLEQLGKEDILRELGIELAGETAEEPASEEFPFRCGSCAVEKVFSSEGERRSFAQGHECQRAGARAGKA